MVYPVCTSIVKHEAEIDQAFTGGSLPVMKVIKLGQGHPLQTWLIDLLIGQSIQQNDSGVRTHSIWSLGVVLLKGWLVKL